MIYNLGSINVDHFYSLTHLPEPGETVIASGTALGLGGKGANISVAVAKAGARVQHIGSIGWQDHWALRELETYGVSVEHISATDHPTGHAIIYRDLAGENSIVVHSGANHQLERSQILKAMKSAKPADLLILQNETNLQRFSAELGSRIGLRILYVAAPFEEVALMSVLPFLNILILNEVEMKQLKAGLGKGPTELGVDLVVVTQGEQGCIVYDANRPAEYQSFRPPKVDPIDTTGAGDTFAGYFAAGLDKGLNLENAIALANAAAALKVAKKGTTEAVPSQLEVTQFLGYDPTNGA